MVSFGSSIRKLDFSRLQAGLGQPAYKVALCVETKLSYHLKELSVTRDFSDPVTCAPLIGLLLRDVCSVSKIGDASLEIDFGDRGRLVIEADADAESESYSIYLNSSEVIVV
jgi:hypothetical protein